MTAPTGDTYAVNGQGSMTMSIGQMRTLGRTTIPGRIEDLSNSLDLISKALESLELNWIGDSKKDAQDFYDRWVRCAENLFGTKKHPAEGVLSRIAAGVEVAALNYDQAEALVVESWQKYYDVLEALLHNEDGGGGGGGDGNSTPPISEV